MKFRAILSLLDRRIIPLLVVAIFFLSAGTAKANSMIYYTQSYSPYQMNSADLSAPATPKVIYTSGTGSPYAVAVDGTNSRIYFSDPNPTVAKIFSAPIDGNAGDYTPFISNVSAEGIALDPTHGYIYYAQPGSGNVVRANLTDGSGPQIIYTSAGSPRAVAVDPVGGKIYIADYNLGKIIRSDLDGTNPEDLITNVHAKGLGLDTTHGKIYYTDAYNPKFDLVKANLANGSGPEILYSSATGSPGAIAVDPENGYIYFSDWHSTVAKIFKADLDGLNQEVFINNVNSYGIGLYITPSIFTLSGTISDFQGGLLGATVDAGNGSIATTDAGGNFSLNLPNGSYTLKVSKNGYQSGTLSVTISGGNSTGQDLTLSKVPSVTGIHPSSGPESGGTLVTLSGTGFTGAAAVNFGTAVGSNLTVISDVSLTVTSPAGTGTVDVTVTTSGGTSATNSSDEFTYIGTSLISITPPSAITGVANGTVKTESALGLPSSVVLVTDNGKVNANVSWDVDASSYNETTTTEQTFSVSGTVSLPAGVVNPNSLALTATISVTVNAATTTYTVSIGSLTGGSITASPASSEADTTIDLNITPAAGMQLKAGTLKYNTGTQAYTINGTSFSMPATNVMVTAEFEAIPATPNMAPTLQSAATNRSGTQVLLSFDKVMADPASSAGAFSINVTRNSAPLAESVIGITLGSDTTQVILCLDKPLLANDTVQVSYNPGTLTSADGGVLGAFNDSAVTNQAPRPVAGNTAVTSGQQNLAITPESFSSASGEKIIINVPFGINDTTVNVASLLQPVSSGTVTSSKLPELIVTSQVDLNLNGSTPVNVGLSTPTETTISAPEGWDGTINMPTVRATNSVTVTPTSGTTAVAGSVIEVGYGDIPLTLNRPARIFIAGQAGKKVGYVRNGTFYPINTLISYDNYGTADKALAAGGDGYLNSGANLVIYTKHFTQFVIYTETPITSYTVSVGSLTGGSITASPASATAGTTINLTITPATGMQLKAGTLKYYDGTQYYTVNSTSFGMPPANITVTAEFEAIPSTPTSPVISGISPSSGPESGGTTVTLSGTGFTGATAVNFGAAVGTNLTVISDTSIAVTSPAGTGTVDVTVTTPGGTSAVNTSDKFTYNGPALTGITTPSAIAGVANGTAKTALALGLPSSVVLVTDNGNVNANVSWDVNASSYDVTRTTEQTFSVTGTVSLPAGVVNPTSVALTTTISVTVNAATGSGGDSGGSSGGSGSSSGGNSGSTATVTGDVINGHTGQTVRVLEAQVTTGKDGKKTIEINSKEAMVFRQPNGSQSSVGDLSKLGFSSITNPDSEITLTADGTLQIKNLANGTDSIFTLTYDLGNGQKITIGTIEVKVGSDGKASFSLTLIDPYGIITDPTTGQPVVGAKVTLYYANTERNKNSGKTPDTVVQLPVLDGFKPNNNQNPQVSDVSGAYGFMVFPTSDYYIAATKEGYEDYKSSTISVEQEIVKWDFKMNQSITGVKRLAGLTSVDTALEIAKANYTTKLSNVVLATAENYPDALAGSVLAYKLNAPILLVGSTAADQDKILDYLKSNLEENGTVYILGGTAVVSAEMESKIIASGFSKITRLGGIDRYETAVKIADQLEVKSGTPIVLAYGENYPDALSISSIAAGMQSPILLVQKEEISNTVEQKIAEIKPTKVYIIGGEGVISSAVENRVAQITSLDKSNIIRISGEDRYETSLAVAQYFNSAGQSVCIATGNNFPDALAGSVYAANFNAPIILTEGSFTDQAMNYLKNRTMTGATLFGGEAVISKEIEQQFEEIIGK